MINSETASNPHDIIPRLIDYIYDTSKCANAKGGDQLQWRMSIGFRKFVALSWIMRPSAVGKDLPAWKVAESLGISPAHFSRLCRQLSKDMGGIKNPSMRSESHCRACSRSRTGVKPTTEVRRATVTTATTIEANRYRESEQTGIKSALKAFSDGKAWSKKQTRLLYCAGLIDLDGVFTKKGVEAMGNTDGGRVNGHPAERREA